MSDLDGLQFEPVESVAAEVGPPVGDPTVTLREFVRRESGNVKEPLVLCAQGTLLPAGGLMQVVGPAGEGKTTFAVDLVLHAAAGLDYLCFRFPSPVRVLFIELEGPRMAFRDKVEARLRDWPHDGDIRIWDDDADDPWGSVRLPEHRARLRHVVAEHRIDLVVADSLTRFGVRGNGTPEETREFMDVLNEVGLSRDLAFLLLHHTRSRLDPRRDLLEQISGAWAPHLDAALVLKRRKANGARLSFPKLRWANGHVPDLALMFDPEYQTFSLNTENPHRADSQSYEDSVLDFVAAHAWATTDEIDGGTHGRVTEIRKARQRLAEAGRIIGRPSREVGLPGKAMRWDLAQRAASCPVPVPGDPIGSGASNPGGRIPVPSPLGDRGTDGAEIDGARKSAHCAIDAEAPA